MEEKRDWDQEWHLSTNIRRFWLTEFMILRLQRTSTKVRVENVKDRFTGICFIDWNDSERQENKTCTELNVTTTLLIFFLARENRDTDHVWFMSYLQWTIVVISSYSHRDSRPSWKREVSKESDIPLHRGYNQLWLMGEGLLGRNLRFNVPYKW